MKKWIVIILMLIAMPAALAWDMCGGEIQIHTNCTMTTPTISCDTYNYTIYNINTSIVEQDALVNFATSLYYFNWTQPKGDYLVTLCDGTAREVQVTEGDDNEMITAALILIPLLLGLFFILGAFLLSNDHGLLKVFLYLLGLLTFFVSCWFGLLAVIKFFDWVEMQNAVGDVMFGVGLVFFMILVYFAIEYIKDYTKGKREDYSEGY